MNGESALAPVGLHPIAGGAGELPMLQGLADVLAGDEPRVVATGGLAVLFDSQPGLFDIVDPDLTLDGMALLAMRAMAR